MPADPGLPTGTVTFLRSDIVGSMELVRALGARYDELNAEHAAIVRAAIAEHAGHVVRTEGDAFFVVFTDAGAAARAAVAIQRAMAEQPWPDGHPLRVRIGIHTGLASRAGDDYGGFEVSRAARIAALGHGGQIVLSEQARALIAADPPPDSSIGELGRVRLKGVAEPERLFQLEAAGLPHDFPPLRVVGQASMRNLPGRVTSLIGREDDLARLRALLSETRLLTLTGAGGTGKTTLALELARTPTTEPADGTFLVDLQAVRDVALVRGAIARGLGLHDGPTGSAAERLPAYVADRELLVIIDNFEQVVDAAPVVTELLEASPASRVVVTSRVRLRLSEEQEFAVRPLRLDADGPEAESEAVRLFVGRLGRVRPGRDLEPAELATVRGICQLLDGLPLAIELTAARAGALPLSLIQDRLEKRLPLPGSGPRDLPERQRTLEAAVEWSTDLLEPPLQRLYERLSVFDGSFDLEQVEAVVGGSDVGASDPLEGIVELTERNLLWRVEDAEGARYAMLETIRAHALARLEARGEGEPVRERHAQSFADLARRFADHVPGDDQRSWLARLEPDAANLRAAATWALEHRRVELAVSCGARPWRFWVMSGRGSLGRRLAEHALELVVGGGPSPLLAEALDGLGSIAYWAGDMPGADELYARQHAVAEALADDHARAMASVNLAYTRRYLGDPDGADAALEEVRALLRGPEDLQTRLLAEWGASLIGMTSGSERALAEVLATADRMDAVGGTFLESTAFTTRAFAAISMGRPGEAARHYMRALRAFVALGDVAQASFGVEAFVSILAWIDEPEAAAMVSGAADAIQERYGVRPPLPMAELTRRPDPRPSLREVLTVAGYDAAVERGRRTSIEEVLDLVERRMDRVDLASIELPPVTRA